MDANEALERRIDELCRENERLRQDNAKLRGARDVWQENDVKLRELLADLAICACGKYCYGCPHQYDGCDRDQRLRELGILEEA